MSSRPTNNTTDIGSTILIMCFAVLVAAFLLLVIGLVYSELMNSDIPRGVANSRKLHMVVCWLGNRGVHRLAPEHRYLAQLVDCDTASCHFTSVAETEFRVDPRRVAVGGDNTGANLAAALCQRLARSKDRHLPFPCAEVLIYPALQMAHFNLPSYQQNHAVPILFRSRMAFCSLQHLNGDSPVCQEVLEGNHIPTELGPQCEEWLFTSNLNPELLT
ncbi:LOW QUALITY PROTEIN: arylacetamide deacetylase-like 4 [Embiotoca jacksoni]|uniref:LOW QUALITY PROTEIN: arylacetamide deacetylase-like 4 n=1 Tax=Embiotoca jacksoni TaxID=100190 RepID=UPI003703BDAD